MLDHRKAGPVFRVANAQLLLLTEHCAFNSSISQPMIAVLTHPWFLRYVPTAADRSHHRISSARHWHGPARIACIAAKQTNLGLALTPIATQNTGARKAIQYYRSRGVILTLQKLAMCSPSGTTPSQQRIERDTKLPTEEARDSVNQEQCVVYDTLIGHFLT